MYWGVQLVRTSYSYEGETHEWEPVRLANDEMTEVRFEEMKRTGMSYEAAVKLCEKLNGSK